MFRENGGTSGKTHRCECYHHLTDNTGWGRGGRSLTGYRRATRGEGKEIRDVQGPPPPRIWHWRKKGRRQC